MDNPTEIQLSIDYAERDVAKLREDVSYYEERFKKIKARLATRECQLEHDRRRLAAALSPEAQRTRVAES